MKKTHLLTMMLLLSSVLSFAQKKIYIPDEWKSNTSLYRESDPNGEATWSKTRSVENDDLIIFWDNGYGDTKPSDLPTSDFYRVDIDDLMKKCQSYYDLEYNTLGFVNPETTNLRNYKMMVLVCHTNVWTCYGGGYDYEVNALWINPATCKPVGLAVAHEVGHSFHYMCYADASGNNHHSSSTIGTGFHLPVGSGATIWEQTANWQATQSYPEAMFTECMGAFRRTHYLAFQHEVHRYQSYWFFNYLCQYYNDIRTVANVWNQPMTGAVDFNQSLMANKNLTPAQLYKMYFDYACRCVTWDYDIAKPYRDKYIGDFDYRCSLTADGEYQVASLSCPQATGFNVIPLQVPEAGTDVTVHLTALIVGSALASSDPGQYLRGIDEPLSMPSRRYSSNNYRSYRGFRMGMVALMKDGSRQYFSKDSVYCRGSREVTADYTMTVPEGVSKMWLVVSPALSKYLQHPWDNNISNDDMWPYKFTLEGTDIGSRAVVYADPELDGRKEADATFVYDVTYPRTTGSDHSGTTVSVSGKAAATLGTAFQTKMSNLKDMMQAWTSAGPSAGKVMYYGVNANGKLAGSGSTANGYGHWFNAAGNVSAYGSGYVYCEFSPANMVFTLGQYPGRCSEGGTYTMREALRYKTAAGDYALATFVFNIKIGPEASVKLRSIDYTDPAVTAVESIKSLDTHAAEQCYGILGYALQSGASDGLVIKQGKKYMRKK